MKHQCHALFCLTPCPARMLMCQRCWAMVDPATQAEVYRTVKLRGPSCDHTWAPWWRASHSAIAEVARQTPERFAEGWNVDVWLTRQLSLADELERKP